jgi:hypothetical protein
LLWASGTDGQPVGEAILQTDGNLVLYGPAHSDGSANPLWASGTNGDFCDTLQVQDDGNVVIYQFGNPLWSTNTAGVDTSFYLTPGHYVLSPDGLYQLTLLTNGDLAEYDLYGNLIWDSGTAGQPVIEAILQTDGNLVLYGPGPANPLWASGTNGHMGDTLQVQDDGNVVIYEGSTPLWATNTAGVDTSFYLMPGQSVYSPDGLYQLTLLTNGDLAEYDSYGNLIWDSGTAGQPVIEAILQTDGNLVLYGPAHSDGSAHALWASGTNGDIGDTLSFGSDGVWIYTYDGTPVWNNGMLV